MMRYKRFLEVLLNELVEAIRECENVEWHHMPPTLVEWQHYNRLCQWATTVHGRLSHYATVKKTKFAYVPPALPEAPSFLGRQLNFGGNGERDDGHPRPLGDAESVRQVWPDFS